MYIIGICGLSGSGKSSVSRAVVDRFPGKIAVLEHDMYYYAKKDKPKIKNYDHPDALETGLLFHHFIFLRKGRAMNSQK